MSTEPSSLTRIRVPKASDVLANELRARILESDMRPGAPLPSETELIVEHQFSRGTVREALRLLESEGFIAIQRGPKGGITVRYPDVQVVSRSLATLLTLSDAPLEHLFQFRKLVEPAATANVAMHATEEQCEQLLAATESRVRDRGSPGFHKLLSDFVENDLLRVILNATNHIVHWHVGIEQVAEAETDRAGQAHQKIAKAIANHDGDAAAAAMLRHIEAFESVMRKQGRLEEAILPRARWSAHLRNGLRES